MGACGYTKPHTEIHQTLSFPTPTQKKESSLGTRLLCRWLKLWKYWRDIVRCQRIVALLTSHKVFAANPRAGIQYPVFTLHCCYPLASLHRILRGWWKLIKTNFALFKYIETADNTIILQHVDVHTKKNKKQESCLDHSSTQKWLHCVSRNNNYNDVNAGTCKLRLIIAWSWHTYIHTQLQNIHYTITKFQVIFT